MKKTTVAALASALAFSMTAAAPAMAGDAQGKFQVKVLGSAVLPDGKIVGVKSIDTLTTTLGGAVAGVQVAQSKANDNYVPTLAVEYFVNPNFSIETICCFTQHHVNGAGNLSGRLVDHVLILPATVTAKAHLDLGVAKPYVGVGPSLFVVFGEKPGAAAAQLDVTRVKMSNDVGFALQAGVDIPVNKNGLGVTLDAKKYFQDITATFYEGSDVALKTKHSLDPWVLSAGLSYRF